MKKIGTITFHVAHNYGAMLQAYALPTALTRLGYQAEVIDYRFPYIYQWGYVESYHDLIKKHGTFGGGLRWIKRRLTGYYNPSLKIHQFNDFRENVIPHSIKAYHSKSELSCLDYDAILFGSDQIWNQSLTDGVATEFVGDFPCLEKTKKISYAASNGRNEFSEKEKIYYYPCLSSYSAIGVREKGLCDSLNADGFNAQTVLDPTLLLVKKEWDKMYQNSSSYINTPKKDYLLVYAFDESEEIYSIVDELSKQHHLDVVVIAYEKKERLNGYTVYTNCGPSDFVKLIANATMVLTTSFHGTVFSILYEKDFYCIPHPTLHERTDSLLNLVGLDQRNINEEGKHRCVYPIDWNAVNQVLEEERKKSIQFVIDAIG